MFTLIKILGRGRNVPEPKRYTLTENASLSYGTPATLAEGRLTPITATSTAPATHLVMASTEGKEALCARISPDMIFETTLMTDAADLCIGTEYLLSADGHGLSATPASGSLRGACLFDNCDARKSGDTVLVYFQNGL